MAADVGERFRLREALPDRATVGALCQGTVVMLRYGWEWLAADGWQSGLFRLGGVAVGVVTVVRLPSPYTSVVLTGGLIGWGVAALILAERSSPPPPKTPAQPADPVGGDERQAVAEDEHQAPLDEPVPEPELDEVAALIRRVAGTDQGAHLDQLVATAELPWDKTELKRRLENWALPVKEFKLRPSGRQRVRLGVRVRDLPAPLGEESPTPSQEPAATGRLTLTKPGASDGSDPLSSPESEPVPGAGVER